jgi:hypothetical protein
MVSNTYPCLSILVSKCPYQIQTCAATIWSPPTAPLRCGAEHKFNPIDPWYNLKAPGFNPSLSLSSEKLVSKFAFKFNVYRSTEVLYSGRITLPKVGGDPAQAEPVLYLFFTFVYPLLTSS